MRRAYLWKIKAVSTHTPVETNPCAQRLTVEYVTAGCRRLVSLSLGFLTSLTDRVMECLVVLGAMLARVLSLCCADSGGSEHLRCLDIRKCKFTDEGLQYFGRCGVHGVVQRLACHVTTMACRHARCDLTYLNTYYCNFSDAGLMAVAPRLHNARHLNLTRAHLTDRGTASCGPQAAATSLAATQVSTRSVWQPRA